jgi:hypothetical protein
MSALEQQPSRPFGLLLMIGLNLGFGVISIVAAGQLTMGLRMKLDPTFLPEGLDPGIVVGLQALPLWFLVFVIAMSLIKAPLLLVSGWGYFQFRRIAGRWVGNAYAVVSLVDSAVAIVGLPYPIAGGTVIGILYPVFTLLAINGPYKALLTR